VTEFRIVWRLLRRLLRALGLRLRRWGDALTAGTELEQGADKDWLATEQHGLLHIVAPPGMPDARSGRRVVRQGGKPALARLVRAARVSMPQRASAPPAKPVPAGAAKAAAASVSRPSPEVVRQRPSTVKRVPPGAPVAHAGAPPDWQARAGQAGPPRDWLARVERAAPPDWVERMARQSAPAPQSVRVGKRMARALELVLPRLRSAVRLARMKVAASPLRAAPPGAGTRDPAPPYPKAWPILRAAKREDLAPHFTVAAGAAAPWLAPPPDADESPHGALLPNWQEPVSTLRHHAAELPPTGPWPPLPPLEGEPEGDVAAAALREHERLRRIDVEQRGIGWNAWLS
jgi:hypothetical protein